MDIPPASPAEQADRLRALPCRGTFESHLTVTADDPTRREAFKALCDRLGVKCVLIELARGVSPSQPMTATYHQGDLAQVLTEVEELHTRLWEGGFPVVRVKLEAVASNPGVPITDAEAAHFPDGYFEFHAKLCLPAGVDLERLGDVCVRHGAHLSRNDRKREEDGTAERFVTLRVHRAGRERALAVCDALVRDLETAGFRVVQTLREFALYDGKVDLDAGWLDPHEEGDDE
jgi:hypothetical protein